MKIDESIFKAYDIRGIYPEQINEKVAYAIGQAYAKFVFGGKENITVALGRDVRLSGPVLFEAMRDGLLDHGVNVVDIGMITTDMMYFAVANYGYDGGLTITASHNPGEFNGVKMVREKGIPISGDTGIQEIKDLVASDYSMEVRTKGGVTKKDVFEDYIKKVLSVIDIDKIKPTKIVANINFGPMAKNLRRIAQVLPLEIVWLNEEPNGEFPKGRPDPLIPENRNETIALVRRNEADLGVAWDSDADRCFFFDETGRFLSGYFTTAVLSEYLIGKHGPGKILVDSKLNWATIEKVKSLGGEALYTRTGHSFYKAKMIKEQALFGGEVSAHYFFRDFYYLDNGLIPLLLVLEMLSQNNKKLSQIYQPYFNKYFAIEETNIEVGNVDIVIDAIRNKYSDGKFLEIDGIAIEFPTWRLSVRSSNTEAVLRLNMEAKSQEILDQKLKEVVSFIGDNK